MEGKPLEESGGDETIDAMEGRLPTESGGDERVDTIEGKPSKESDGTSKAPVGALAPVMFDSVLYLAFTNSLLPS